MKDGRVTHWEKDLEDYRQMLIDEFEEKAKKEEEERKQKDEERKKRREEAMALKLKKSQEKK